MRDHKDNFVVICSIENLDPMGVHTGDSITVAPAQTLTDREYQRMRDAARKVMSEIGIETGGSNVQFAVDPKTGRMVIIEMNPRVSRSSALASKATGFPIAKFAAKLAVGLTLDEIPNDITKYTPASFEPTIDYCVVKIPRFAFEKFEGVDDRLTTQMKSVGEAMSIGRTFKEALQKGLRSLGTKRFGLGGDGKDKVLDQALETREEYLQFIKTAPQRKEFREKILAYAKTPREDRIFYLKYAYLAGYTTEEIYQRTSVDPWFLAQLKQIIDMEQELLQIKGNTQAQETMMRKAKKYGFSDRQLAFYWGLRESDVRKKRKKLGIKPVYKLVDTCAGEFKAYTPYFYSTYEEEDEANPSRKKKVMILGGGPNRIGQGIEFDYCCVHAVLALKKMGYETIMVNSNPETVSTDYDTSDKLFFEPLTLEDVLNIYENEKPLGVILQLGGQTPLNLAKALEANGVRILGTSVKAIDRAEDRDKFKRLLHKIQLSQPANGIATSLEEACEVAKKIGYPVVVRPSYVLGGRAMEIAYDESSLKKYMKKAVEASGKHPVLIDKFLEDATEMDVDLISDGKASVVGAVMEHIEEAGIHSGDSASVIPPFSVSREIVEEVISKTKQIAKELRVVGLMNVQYAIQKGQIYCLEVNPRASRTVPFVSKTINITLAKLSARLMAGKTLKELKFTEEVAPKHVAVKESVFPFVKFPGVDIILSPEMKSTGEVMGIDKDFGKAFYKSQDAAMSRIPRRGTVFISVKDPDKPKIPEIARSFHRLGFKIVSTKGTAQVLRDYRVPVQEILKITEGSPNIADWVRNKKINLIINTPSGKGPMLDEGKIRSLAVSFSIPCITTISAARAAVRGLQAVKDDELDVKSIHDYHDVRALKG
jgi:carbamoyl-phosphate synthase large subunit